MPLHNLFKIMEFDMKESTLYNTSWQVQYFSLFMNAGAGKKIEMSEGFFLRSIFYGFFPLLIAKLSAEEQRNWRAKKSMPYTGLVYSVYMVVQLQVQGVNTPDKLTKKSLDYLKSLLLSKRKH